MLQILNIINRCPTLAPYFVAKRVARVVLPESAGPTMHTLQGFRGCGFNMYGRGFRKNFSKASIDDITYSLSRKLLDEKIDQ